jgi:hypothetical protein
MLPIALASITLSCSCVAEFAVVNGSDAPAAVSFALPPGDSIGWPRTLAIAPAASDSALERASWRAIALDSLRRLAASEGNASRVRIEIPPRSALRLGTIAADCAGGIFGVDAPTTVVVEAAGRQDTLRVTELPKRVRAVSRALYVHAAG